MYVSFIPVVEIVIAGNKKELRKCLTQTLQGFETEVQGLQIDRSTMMMPVAQKKPCVTIVRLCSSNDPVHKLQTVLIVQHTVGFQSEMYVSERDRSLE